jgi:hypothetical protein
MATAVESTTTTTTTSVSSSFSSSSASVRYTRLVSVLEKALTKSRQHFNVKQAVAQVYGDDANIFGCAASTNSSNKKKSRSSNSSNKDDEEDEDQTSNNMLRQVFESMLDRIEEEVSEYMLQEYFVQNDVEEKFLKLEAIIELLRRQEIQRQQMEEADKQSARLAVEAAKRPKYRHAGAAGGGSVTATIQEMQAQRNALLQQVEAFEAENCTLQEKKTLRVQAHKAKGSAAHVVQQLAMELKNSADVGSVFDK